MEGRALFFKNREVANLKGPVLTKTEVAKNKPANHSYTTVDLIKRSPHVPRVQIVNPSDKKMHLAT